MAHVHAAPREHARGLHGKHGREGLHCWPCARVRVCACARVHGGAGNGLCTSAYALETLRMSVMCEPNHDNGR